MSEREEFFGRAFDTDAIITRLKERFNVKSDRDFAKALNISQSTLSSWRSRQSIPLTYIIAIANKLNVSTDWIFFGEPIQLNVEASDMDEAIMRICIVAVLNTITNDTEKQLDLAEKMLFYYSMMRKMVSTLKKVDGMSQEKTMEVIQMFLAKFNNDI